MARIVTDKAVIDAHFTATMLRAWGVNPQTKIRVVDRNIYTIQFVTKDELERVLGRGIWTYKQDVVALKRIQGQADLGKPEVKQMELWCQWHRIPHESVTHEGLLMVAQSKVGVPLSDVEETFLGGQKFYRNNMLLPIDAALKDKVSITHPNIGTFNAYLVYERVNRICLFCAKIGHEHTSCADRVRMQRLRLDPRFKDRPEMEKMTQPRLGPWVNNPALMPTRDNCS